MKANEIILEAMKTRGYNQTILADVSGLKRQSNVSELLRSKNMRVDSFVKLLDSMGFEIEVKDKNSANKVKWKLGNGVDSE